MILPRFDFIEPVSIKEACSILQQKMGKAVIIAGGTDLLVNMKRKKITEPEVIISLAKIPQLRETSYSDGDGLKMGSMVIISELAESKTIIDNFPLLSNAASQLGSTQIRNRATVGGNISSARPAADTLGPLIAYGAKLKLVGTQGERFVSLEAFSTAPGKTVSGPSEILTEILIRTPSPKSSGSYVKFGARRAMEIAIVNVTALITFDSDSRRCKEARIVLGAVGPTFVRCLEAEEVLAGNEITADLAAQAGIIASRSCSPISDIRGSAEYRKMLVEALTKRTVMEACSITAS